MKSASSQSPDIISVDASQIMYHIVWPHEGQLVDLVKSIETRLSVYPHFSDKILVFDKHSTTSAKNHERARRTVNKILEYDLTWNSHAYTHEEADVTIISRVIECSRTHASTI